MLARETGTQHLVTLRPLRTEDIPQVCQWRTCPEIRNSIGFHHNVTLEKAPVLYLPAVMDPEGARAWHYAIEEDSLMVGVASILELDADNRSCRLELLIGSPERWGQGLGASALQRLLSMVFEACQVHRVSVEIPEDNAHAARLFRNAGFSREGLRRDALRIEGNWRDVALLSLLNTDWKRRNRPDLWHVDPLAVQHHAWMRNLCPETGCEPYEVEKALSEEEGWVWSFEEDYAGFATLEWREREVEIRLLAVDPAYRRCGLATRMLHSIREKAQARGMQRILLVTANDNGPALRLYQKTGFALNALYAGRLEKRRGSVRLGLDGIPIRDDLELVWDL